MGTRKVPRYGRSKKKRELEEQKEQLIKQKLNDLDAVFAGSSDEEGELDVVDEASENDESKEDESKADEHIDEIRKENGNSTTKKQLKKALDSRGLKRPRSLEKDGHEADSSSSEDSTKDEFSVVAGGVESEEELDLGHVTDKSRTMSNAMLRILQGGAIPPGHTSKKKLVGPVLSKTTTKLEKAQDEDRQSTVNLHKTRVERRKNNLKCMHIPLSVRMSNGADPAKVAKEVQSERAYRRIATRGVVALFNAIAQHQDSKRKEESQERSKEGQDSEQLTKSSFLEKIRSTGTENINDSVNSTLILRGKSHKEESQDLKKATGWNALKDDFMMGSKLKNWDVDNSESDSNAQIDGIGEDDDISV